MKRTLRTISSLLLAWIIVMGLSATAFAAESTVTFKGKTEDIEIKPGSGYTGTDLFEGFKDVMPGDKLTESIEIKNKATDCDYIKVYLQALLHDEQGNPLIYNEDFEEADGKDADLDTGRDETAVTMQDFLAQLTMRVYNGSELIYEASPDELDGLAEPVFLASLRKDQSITLTVELDVPIELGNEYAYRVGEVDWKFKVEAFDNPSPSRDYTKMTAHKIWDDHNDPERPDRVTVHLLRNGEFYKEAELNAENQWTYTWSRLDEDDDWSVIEADAPDEYIVEYDVQGNTTHITNIKGAPSPDPDPDPDPEPIPDPDSPSDPPSPAYLTVKKTWSGDENDLENRPDSVGVTLYSGKTAVETVWLGDWNNWTYTWTELDGSGEWGVLEVIPKGYTPSYSVSGRVITITNTATLIQTGQLNWPVPVLGGLGVLMIAFGASAMLRKRKNDRA